MDFASASLQLAFTLAESASALRITSRSAGEHGSFFLTQQAPSTEQALGE